MILSIFLCVNWPFVYFLWRDVSLNPLPILNLDSLFIVELGEFFVCFGFKCLIRYTACKYFLSFCGLPSRALKCVLWSTQGSEFGEGQCLPFSLFARAFSIICEKHCLVQGHQDLLPWVFLVRVCILALTFSSMIHFAVFGVLGFFFCMWCKVGVQLYFFDCGYPVPKIFKFRKRGAVVF